MPLLKKKTFEKADLPENLDKNEKVFYCSMTNEIFRDYEEFCQRIILCNSMVWTCSFTGKSGLTYSEAIESELNAQQLLKDFPTELRIPILYLASKTHKTSFNEMAEDVFLFVRDHYFIGENVEASFSGNRWRESHILQVIAPTEEEIEASKLDQYHPSLYRYEVEQLDAEDADVSEVMIVKFEQVRRKKYSFTKEKNKLFLKQFVNQDKNCLFVVKESIIESYGIHKIKFDQIFDGPLPNFNISKKLSKVFANGKKTKQETLAQFLKKENGLKLTENGVNLTDQMRKRQEEFQQMKQKRLEEKLMEKQKRRKDNLRVANTLKEWYRLKEDLELDDHKVLPQAIPVQSTIPEQYMGDVLEVLEFIHSFSKFLHVKDFFPDGLTLELFERSLMQNEIAGPLVDIVQLFLTALFTIQVEEASQYSSAELKEKDMKDNVNFSNETMQATVAANLSITQQGLPLSKLPLYSLTTSEILRLHLLSSGARINESGSKWRYQHRGGYTHEDDPGFYLRLNSPLLLKSLSFCNITDLSVGDKISIITCLMNQLLTYADVRDLIEDRLEKSRQAKMEIKTLQANEKKCHHEFITSKLKIKREGAENKKDVSVEIENLQKESEQRKIQNEKQIFKFLKQSLEHQTTLGLDRAYRRYLKLKSVPGIFVNWEEPNSGSCLKECVKPNFTLVGANRNEVIAHIRKVMDSEAENKTPELNDIDGVRNNFNELLMCNANPDDCIVHSGSSKKPLWSFYNSDEQITELLGSLNKRGVRESELSQVVENEEKYISLLINNTPICQLNASHKKIESTPYPLRKTDKANSAKYKDANLGYPEDLSCDMVLELALIDNILEMEEKIHNGALGCLKVKDRNIWRENLSKKNYEELDKTVPSLETTFPKINKKEMKNGSRPETPDSFNEYNGHLNGVREAPNDPLLSDNDLSSFQSDHVKLAIKSLATALTQVAQGVEKRYLKKPLGHAGLRNKHKEKDYDIIDRWELALREVTSFSQIFLYFSTLDNCVMWSRSALIAKCSICRKQNDSENMLLCDNCNKGSHLYCLRPKLKSVPQGDWFCKECQKIKEKEAILNNPPPVPVKKRRLFEEVASDEEGEPMETEEENIDENSEEHENLEEEEDISQDDDNISQNEDKTDIEQENEKRDNEDVCSRCNMEGTLVYCANCTFMYHLECAEPPLRRVPRGDWLCRKCKNKRNRESDSDDNEDGRSKRRLRRDVDNRDDLPLHNAPLQELLADVLRQDDAWPFLRPVHKYEVPDYYDIISKPMDFGTIKYKLNMGEYQCDAQVMADAALVFENCNTYNNSSDEVYKCGIKLRKYFINKCRQLGLRFPNTMECYEEGDDDESNNVQKITFTKSKINSN